MKYITGFIVLLFSLTSGGLGFYIGRLLGAIVEYVLEIRLELIEYVFALPASIIFAVLGGSLVIAYIKSTDFLAQKFAEFVVDVVDNETDNQADC